ncbi:MAG: hypothetical protein JXB10_09370 [Pirellulales bacterium]|nr:hypothetical protein [Pirellulales bacterium]
MKTAINPPEEGKRRAHTVSRPPARRPWIARHHKAAVPAAAKHIFRSRDHWSRFSSMDY